MRHVRPLSTFILLASATGALPALAQPAQPPPDAPPAQPAPSHGDKDKLLPGDEAPVDKAPPGDKAPAKPSDVKGDEKKAEAKKAEDDKKAADEKGKKKGDGTESDTNVFAEEWWTSARPTIELHGYYRVRSQLYSHLALGRVDDPGTALWPQPTDDNYTGLGFSNKVVLCGSDPLKPTPCDNNIQAGANMRFRVNPELHISDNVRIMAQIDLLDNVVLGSTPEGYVNQPSSSGGYQQVQRGGYTPLGAFATTQYAPTAGQNSLQNSITVKRVWGEYMTPIGLLRFGRMPSHWGLGMLVNSGDGYDSDYGSTADRIMFITGIKKWDLYFGGLWDFVNEGPTSAVIGQQQGQPYDLAQSDDVNQWGVVIVRRRNADLQKLELAQGKVVVNGGFYGVYRNQFLDYVGNQGFGAKATDISAGYVRRGAQAFIPDFWFQFLWQKFRFEAEAAVIAGSIENTALVPNTTNYKNPNDPNANGWKLLQFGLAVQAELRAVEDKLHIQADFGYATGDSDVQGLAPPANGLELQLTRNRNFSTFRFNPDYRIDMILWREILNRVQGAYYVKPEVDYDFTRNANGQRIGGGGAVVWSRASQFVQAPGHARDLGVELDFQLYYQAKDGTLNDDLSKMGGFYTSAQFGVLFPLGGLGYLSQEKTELQALHQTGTLDTALALRWWLGIMF